MTEKASMDFPEPDSPTKPTHSPALTDRLTSFTARTAPSGVRRTVFSSRISRRRGVALSSRGGEGCDIVQAPRYSPKTFRILSEISPSVARASTAVTIAGTMF